MTANPAELAKLRSLMDNARAMGWRFRLGYRGRAVITRPKGGSELLHAVLCSYRGEIADMLREAARPTAPQRPALRLVHGGRRE